MRENNIKLTNETRLALWEEHLEIPIVALDKALKYGKLILRGLGPSARWKQCLAMAGVGFLQSLWEKPIWEGVWPYLDPMVSVCLRTASMEWNVPGKYGPHGELFFFLIQKEPARVPDSETFSPFMNSDIRTPFYSADDLKMCALLALHIIAEEGRDGDGFQVPVLEEEWKMGCPKSPRWESEGEAWSEDEDASSTASREGNVCNDALPRSPFSCRIGSWQRWH